MITAKVSTQDINRLSRKMLRTSGQVKKAVADDLAEAAINIQGEAKVAVQSGITDKGRLASSIYIEKRRSNGLLWEVGANARYAPFVEFGTGKKVDLRWLLKAGFPTSYAAQFKGKGIRQVNLNPRPFLFPAFVREVPRLKARVRKTLMRYGKTF